MSTFIYTLQRKVQELQNTLRSLQEQNSHLKNKARMLSEAAPPGPPPEGTPSSQDNVYFQRQHFEGGLGHSAFVTRTTHDPRQSNNFYDNPLYSGYRVRGVIDGVDVTPPGEYTYQGGLIVPRGISRNATPEDIAQLMILNARMNPALSFGNFANFESFLQAFTALLGNVYTSESSVHYPPTGSPLLNAQAILALPEMQNWMQSGYSAATQNGIWYINHNWPF